MDETDEKAMQTALKRASRAYVGFLRPAQPGQSFEDRVTELSARFTARGEHGAAEIMGNIFDPQYLAEHDLAFIGSPDTVARKLREASEKGLFNVFMGEFNFADLPEEDLMRSIRLFVSRIADAVINGRGLGGAPDPSADDDHGAAAVPAGVPSTPEPMPSPASV